jgi:hypothetical protein
LVRILVQLSLHRQLYELLHILTSHSPRSTARVQLNYILITVLIGVLEHKELRLYRFHQHLKLFSALFFCPLADLV